MMRKISPETNVVNWFEIPVLDTARAKKFYETILDISMQTRRFEETGEELTLFPATPFVIQATSGRVTGGLTKGPNAKPSAEGALVYLNANPSIQAIINRIVPAGGKVLVPKTEMIAGFIAVFLDTEGNRVALHAIG